MRQTDSNILLNFLSYQILSATLVNNNLKGVCHNIFDLHFFIFNTGATDNRLKQFVLDFDFIELFEFERKFVMSCTFSETDSTLRRIPRSQAPRYCTPSEKSNVQISAIYHEM